MSGAGNAAGVTIQVANAEGFEEGAQIEQTERAVIIGVGDKSMTVLHASGQQQTLLLSKDTQARPGMYAEVKKVATVLNVNRSTNELTVTPWANKN